MKKLETFCTFFSKFLVSVRFNFVSFPFFLNKKFLLFSSPYRSDPWSVAPKNSNPPMGSRPFTYLEEPKRPIPVKPPVTPPNDQQWRRDPWPPAPPVPEPDYSPKPRKLKSALKTY